MLLSLTKRTEMLNSNLQALQFQFSNKLQIELSKTVNSLKKSLRRKLKGLKSFVVNLCTGLR